MQIQELDVAIIGAGPAGIQAAYYFNKTNLNYNVFEASGMPGAFFNKYPVHRQLISINKKHTGYDSPELKMRWDWNSLLSDEYTPLFSDLTDEYFADANTLVTYIAKYIEHHNISVSYNSPIRDIETVGDKVHFTCNDCQYIANKVIVSTGLSVEYMPKNIPGIEHAVSYGKMSVDGADYANKRVLILGKGNSAFETADHLTPFASMIHVSSPNPLKLAWQTHYVGHLRAVNNNFLDTYQLKSQNAILDADIQSIEKTDSGYDVTVKYKHAQGEIEKIQYDIILSACGFTFNPSIFKQSHNMCEKRKYPLHDANWESEQYKGVFFAGTVMHYRDYKKYTSGFIHGFRYNVKRLSESVICTLDKTHVRESEDVVSTPSALSEKVIERINLSSAIWQQPGFLCDFYNLEENGYAVMYPDQSYEQVQEKIASEHLTGFYVSLEYGTQVDGNLFAANRIHRNNLDESNESKFIHPIIYLYKEGELVGKKHVIEDLFGEWNEDIHIEQVKEIIASYMSTSISKIEEHIYA